MSEATVFHGVPSWERLRELRRIAPNLSHGAEFLPERLTWQMTPWFLDNGAYSGNFDPDEWVSALEKVASSDVAEPEWVVLPDVFKDWSATLDRHADHVEAVTDRGFKPAVVAQPPAGPAEVRAAADRFGADVVLVGGGADYTYRGPGRDVLSISDLHVHVGEPGPCYVRPFELGADSIDTSSTVRRGCTRRLLRLDQWAAASDPLEVFR